MTIQRKDLSRAEFRLSFERNARAFGFNEARIEPLLTNIFSLVARWRNDRYVDIYEQSDKHCWGMIKPSKRDSRGRIIQYYIDFYHARVIPGMTDPLLLLTFEEVEGDPHPWLILESLINHDQFFGRHGMAKKLQQYLDNLRKALLSRINAGRRKDKKSITP